MSRRKKVEILEKFDIHKAVEEFRQYLIKKYTLNWKKTYIPFALLSHQALYYMMVSERTDGKSYISFEFGLWLYINYGFACALIRRWDMDIKGQNGFDQIQNLIGENSLVIERTKGKYNNLVEEMTDYKYNSMVYKGRKYYLCKRCVDEDGNETTIIDNDWWMIARAISQEEHNRGGGLERIKLCIFDEFMTRDVYLTNEYILFNNVLSTIIRRRDDVVIFMLGNTINGGYSIYYDEMLLTNMRKMKQGTIDYYTYGDNPNIDTPSVAVELIDYVSKEYKKSNKYFSFSNPKLQAITQGKWEIGSYPHIPCKYAPKDVVFNYFIEFKDDKFECEIVVIDNNTFTAIHPWTSDINIKDTTIIFNLNAPIDYHYRRKINKPFDEVGDKIAWYFMNNKVCYSSNLVGEQIYNYLKECNM